MSRSAHNHLDRVAAIGCVLCWLLDMSPSGKIDLHHPRMGTAKGKRRSDWCVIPLCHDGCHQGRNGVHGDRSLLRLAKVDEMDLLGVTIQRVYG